MIILGIDPGTVVTGYGLIESSGGEQVLIGCGSLASPERLPIGERLCSMYHELQKIIVQYHPDVAAVEHPFVAKNVRSALAIGRAQAVALLAVAEAGIPVHEYAPAQVKRMVANYGASSKEQVQEMVKLQLDMNALPHPTDAADALAVAICHARESHLDSLVERQGEKP